MKISELFDLKGRGAVITGGAGFLGVQHAQALLEAGCKVALWDKNQDLLDSALATLTSEFKERVCGVCVDIVDQTALKQAADQTEKQFGTVNILVNNAGLTVQQGLDKFARYFDPFESYPKELWEMALNVNLTGTFLVTQTLAPLLKKNRDRASIINIASDVGVISPDHRIYRANPEREYDGVAFNSPLSYATSKAALIHMTKYWATYWAPLGIRVNSISPAGVEKKHDPKFVRELTDRIPMGRMAKAHELKGAVLFLASDASSFVTGHNLIVDGGRTAW